MKCKIQKLMITAVAVSLLKMALPLRLNAEDSSRPLVQNGTLDLAGYQSSQKGLQLAGDWHFFWRDWLSPELAHDWAVTWLQQQESLALNGSTTTSHPVATVWQAVPGSWHQFAELEGRPSAGAVGSYLLIIRNLQPDQASDLGLRINMFSSGRVYWFPISGQSADLEQKNSWLLHEHGQPALSADSDQPLLQSVVLPLALSNQVRDYGLLVQVASHFHHKGGVRESPQLGQYQLLQKNKKSDDLVNLAIVASILVICLVNFALFLQRHQDLGSLWLGIFGLLVAGRALLVGDFVEYFWPELTGQSWFLVRTRLEYISFPLSAAAFGAFLYFSFRGFVLPAVIVAIWSVALLETLVAVLLPTNLLSQYLIFYNGFAVFATIYYIGLVGYAAIHKEEGSLLAISGMVCLFIGLTNDVLHNRMIIETGLIFPSSMVVFILFQTQIVGRRFARAFRDSENLVGTLREQESLRTQFFQNTSHELRTPLNGILGFTDLLLKGRYGQPTDLMQPPLAKIATLAESLKLQVSTILDLAKSRAGDLTLNIHPVPLQEVLEEAIIQAEGLSLTNSQLKFSWYTNWHVDERPVWNGDREKLMVIIRNLLGNAFKFVIADRPNEVILRMQYSQDTLMIAVEDQGIGMKDADQHKIFDEFRQLEESGRRQFEGTGLGLAMVKSLVQLQERQIKVESKIGQGSRFQVMLPDLASQVSPLVSSDWLQIKSRGKGAVADKSSSSQQVSKPPEVSIVSRQVLSTNKFSDYRILVIDDNAVNCEVIRDILSMEGFPVEVCLDSKKAMATIQANPPNLILLELMMPTVSGEDLLALMKNDGQLVDIPVVLLTAKASQQDRLLGLGLGADDYITKPFLSDEVLLRVRNILARVDLARATSERVSLEEIMAKAQRVSTNLGQTVQSISQIELAVFQKSADISSGDWLGVFHHPSSQRLYLILGDVTGHGVSSALVTIAVAGAVRGALRMIESQAGRITMEESLEMLLEICHESVLESGSRWDRAMTMACVCLDLKLAEACYVNAGHLPIYHMRKDKSQPLVRPGSMLGLQKKKWSEPYRFSLEMGDRLFLYTDGLTENQNEQGKCLRLHKFLEKHQEEMDVGKIKQALVESAVEVTGTDIQDDVSFLLLSWTGQQEVAKDSEPRAS